MTLDDQGRSTLHLRVQHETDVEIALTRPVPVRLPQGTETVDRVHLHADDPRAFVDAVARTRPAAAERPG